MSEQSEQPRRRRRQPPPPSAAPGHGSVARGAILVAVAVVIGVLLLRDDDSSTTQVAVGSDTATDVDEGVTPAEFSELANAPSIGRQFQHLRGRGLKCRAVLDDDVVPETA